MLKRTVSASALNATIINLLHFDLETATVKKPSNRYSTLPTELDAFSEEQSILHARRVTIPELANNAI